MLAHPDQPGRPTTAPDDTGYDNLLGDETAAQPDLLGRPTTASGGAEDDGVLDHAPTVPPAAVGVTDGAVPAGVNVDPDGSLLEPLRFSMVPEWLLDADISDCAVRLYAVLLRYGQTSGQRMPSRALLAQRLHEGRVAAPVRPNPESFTQRTTSSPYPLRDVEPSSLAEAMNDQLLVACGITDLAEYTDEVAVARGSAGRDAVRWSGPCLLAALQTAVKVRGYPAPLAAAALVDVARDPVTRSPMRVAAAGPWWDRAPAPPAASKRTAYEDAELRKLEAVLADRGDRVSLQARARDQLEAAGEPATRLTVARAACSLLDCEAVDKT